MVKEKAERAGSFVGENLVRGRIQGKGLPGHGDSKAKSNVGRIMEGEKNNDQCERGLTVVCGEKTTLPDLW